jgi:hypothetical protein
MTQEIKKEDRVIAELKQKIEKLLETYHARKEDLQWADDDWEVGEIQEDLDGYAREIKKLKAKIKKYQKLQINV